MTHTNDARSGHLDGVRGGTEYHHDHPELHNEDVAHEHSDVNIRAILMFAGGLVLVAIFVHFLMLVMFKWLETRADANDPQLSPLSTQAPQMPRTTSESPFFGQARGGAQLLTNEPRALRELHDRENKTLQGYGWVEGKPGVAHMPIGDAKKLIMERGIPVRAGDPVAPTAGTRAAAMGEASGGRTIPTPTAGAPASPEQPQQPQQPQPKPAPQPAAPHGGHQ